ncbi:MAG: TerB family tellurite resistance protein [Polyangiales bacterium]
MLDSLDKEERLRLMKFICSFAWADLHVQSAERSFVHKMMHRLALAEDEAAQVQEWLEVPPPADELDPNDIPKAHRKLFLDAARALVMADGEVESTEVENLILLEQLLV